MKHEIYTITIKISVCEEMKAKALEETRRLRVFTLGGNGTLQGEGSVFDHATHMGKLIPRIEGGGCPLLVFGIGKQLYLENQ